MTLRLTLAAIALISHLLATAPAALGAKRQTSKSIRLIDCRIKLIDRVTLASDRPGIIAFVGATEGDAVKADQQIAGLRDEVAQARRSVAEREASNDIEVRYAKKAAQVAEADHQKALEVNLKLPNGGIPDIEVQRLKLAAERARLQIEQADNQLIIAGLNLEQAEAELMTYQIVAPFDSVVTMVHKSKGEAVRQGDPIVDLASTSRVRVEADVSVRDVWSIRRGDRVTVQLEIPEVDVDVERQEFEGKVIFIDVDVNPLTREVKVWAEVDNAGAVLREGLKARMTIHVGSPQTAIRRR